MQRVMLSVTLSMATIIGGAGPSPAQDRPAPPPVPDPDWKPKAGDRVTVRQPGSPGLPDRATCERYIRSAVAGDADGTRETAASPGAVQLAADTPVLVIEPHGLPRPATGPASSPEHLNRDIQDAINRAYSRPRPVVSVEARILDGPHGGAVKFIPADSLARMVPAPASANFRAGDRATVAARSIPMGDDRTYLVQFLRDPDGGSNREHVLPLSRGTRLAVLAIDGITCRVRVLPPSRHAGKVGFVKAEGLEVARPEAEKARRR